MWTSDEVWKGVWTRTHQNISKRLVEKFGVDRTIWMVSVILRNWEAFKNSYYIALDYPSLRLIEQFSRSWLEDSETGTVRVFEGTHYSRIALVPPVEGVGWEDATSTGIGELSMVKEP
ncbi:MAG: hypothetical protein M0R80_25000 [Proteobacteria bacterium]|nr:hypothetical protein [Pseudomonadota bacterium]